MYSHSPEHPPLNMDEISKELEEIESKFTPKINKKCPKIPLSVHENLAVLSKEFDSLGLPVINLDKTMPEILHEVVQTSRDLVQTHRNTLDSAKENALETSTWAHKHKELLEKRDDYKRSLERLKDSCVALKNSKAALVSEMKLLKQQDNARKEELDQLKRIINGKEQLFEHNIRRLQLEVDRLKEMCGEDVVLQSSRNDIALKLLKKYKINEGIYKSTIKTLQDNNRQLLEEVLNLKEELILYKPSG